MLLRLMSHVEFKKWPCNCVDLNSLYPNQRAAVPRIVCLVE